MTISEFSNAFDTLLNSYNTKAMFGEGASKMEITLDEYEKSIFLTQAQDQVIKNYFYAHTNVQGHGIDDSERRQIDFSWLITVDTGTAYTEGTPYTDEGLLFKLPDNILYILNERVILSDDKNYVVVPINYREYDRYKSRPYTQPLKKQCWRLFQSDDTVESIAEIIPIAGFADVDTTESDTTDTTESNINGCVKEYRIRYIKRPSPIVLVDLSADNLEIDGYTEPTECKVHPSLHQDILNTAVSLAIMAKGSYTDSLRQRAQQGVPERNREQ